MANYRSMIKGTASALGNKAKEKIKSAAKSDKVRSVYDRSSTTARCYANVAKLNVKINGELEEQKKVFIEIGRLYFDQHRNDPEDYFVPLFEELVAMDQKIETLRAELYEAKASIAAAKERNLEVEIIDFDEDEAPAEDAPAEEAPAEDPAPEEKE